MKRIFHVLKQYDAMITPFRSALTKLLYIMIGVALGMIATYLFAPTQFKNNAQPVQLDTVYREQWIKGVAAEYAIGADQEKAKQEAKQKLIDAGVTADEIARLREANSTDLQLPELLAAIEPIAEEGEGSAKTTAEQYPDPGFMSAIWPLLLYIILVIVGILAAVYLSLFDDPITMVRRRFQKVDPTVKLEQEKAKERVALAKNKEVFDSPPVKQFMSIYNAGDNFYDDSFAIETPDDDRFLGECGSSIAESLGSGPQKKVAATEVWVFAQADIATLTNVMVSEHVYNDPSLRSKLEARGDLILATPGGKAILESKSLRAQVRVIDLKYSDDSAFPPNSVFEKLAIEIAVWEKGGPAGASAGGGDDDDMAMKLPPPIINPPMAQPMPQAMPQAMPPQQPMQPPAQPMPQVMPQQQPPQQPFAQPQQPQAMPPQQPPMQPPQQPQAMPPQQPPMQQPPAQPMQPQAMPPQQQPPQQPPAQPMQPQAMPPQQQPMQPPAQPMQPQPGTMQPPQRAPQQPGTMQPPQRAPQQPGTMQPPQQPGSMQPPRQPGSMQPPQQQQPPSPYGDTNY